MKKNIIFTAILLCLIFCHRSILGEDTADEQEIRKLLSEAYVAVEDYKSAEAEHRKAIEEDLKNVEARIGLADILSWQKKYDESIDEYKKALEIEPDNLEIKRKLAGVLSWDKQYRKALDLYDEILGRKEDVKVRLEKARVLGWAREYDESIKEYEKILEITVNPQIALEKRAKEAYWNNRVGHAIEYYNELIEKEPENAEAMFDLSQIYSYQSMWKKAIKEYKRILDIYSEHFRAKEGLQKTGLASKHILLKTGYVFFDGESSARDFDIRRNSAFLKLDFPIKDNLRIDINHHLTYRNFIDFSDVLENETKINLLYASKPAWWADAFYTVFAYSDDIETMQNFGGNFNLRIFDIGVSASSYRRQRLENNSTVIRGHYYKDSFKQRFDLDMNQRLKIGMDYLFAYYSDDNYKNEPGFDLLYYLLLDPMRLTVKYRYFYKDFNDKVIEYFSPRDFSTNRISFNWRHYLNKEEIFFGADDLYYDLGYSIIIDSEDVVGNKFSAGFNWDINKSLNFNIQGSVLNSSKDVYKDKSLTASIKYYF